MLHIFADPADMQGDTLTVRGEDAGHIRNALRMRPGEEVAVSNGVDGKEYRYVIERIGEEDVLLRLRAVEERSTELPVRAYLFQGLPKAEKMDLIVQKAVELGVYEIIPVSMHRCVMKLDEKRAAKKVERWQKIAEAAAMQSGRRIIPKVLMPMTFAEAVRYAAERTQLCVLPYEKQEDNGRTKALLEEARARVPEGGQARLSDGLPAGIPDERSCGISVIIGPEGGFEEEEVRRAEEAGAVPISLGKRILRTETAGPAFLSWLVYLFEIT